MENLEKGKSYLIKFGQADGLYSITVLLITEKAYFIRWNNGLDTHDKWEEKKVFCRNYNVVEDISDIMQEQEVKDILNKSGLPHIETKMVLCNFCGGLGTVPDSHSTAGNQICPKCLGAKEVVESIRYHA